MVNEETRKAPRRGQRGWPSADHVEVHQGSMTDVLELHSLLEVEGLHPYVADRCVKELYPYWTGANMFSVRLLVPECEAAWAHETLHRRSVTRSPRRDDEAPPLDVANAWGRRLRWWVAFVSSSPIGPALAAPCLPFCLYFVWGYGRFVGKCGSRPPGHGMTWMSLCLLLPIHVALSTLLYLAFASSIGWL